MSLTAPSPIPSRVLLICFWLSGLLLIFVFPRPFYREVYEPNRNWSFVVMDPSTEYWRSTLVGVAQLLKNLSVNGIYIDQIACAPPSSWVTGYRRLLSAVQELGFPVMSEAHTETYQDTVDINLAIYGYDACEHIPLFQAVYSGWTVLMGTKNWDYSSNNFNPTNFAARLAQLLTDGSSLGWFNVQYFAPFLQLPENVNQLLFLRHVVEARSSLLKYLVYGRMLPPVDYIVLPPSVTIADKCPVLQVLVTCWAAPSGERLILMVNHGETAAYLSVRMYDADKNGYVQNATLPPFTVQWQPF
eukprot:m.99778 g.99778  ORF g.99778 m.99778 type:complete len:301 (+) comp13683_c0_seq6:396-1298(+)